MEPKAKKKKRLTRAEVLLNADRSQAVAQLAKHFKSGKIKKKYICKILAFELPTLRARMKDKNLKEWQLEKLEAEGLFKREQKNK